MNNFRRELAQQVAELIRAAVLEQACPDCRMPLLMKEDQDLAFCWFCTTDRRNAQNGRTALTKAQMAASGIAMGGSVHPLAYGSGKRTWPEGVPGILIAAAVM